MIEAKPERARTIHEEFDIQPDAYRSREFGDQGEYYVLNFVLSDLHGAYMPVVQSGPHGSFDEAWLQGAADNVRSRAGKMTAGEGHEEIIAARAFSVQNLTSEEVYTFKQREGWLLEPMIVPQRDEAGHTSMRSIERPYA